MWRRNKISPYTTKTRFLSINGYFGWHFITVDVEQIIHFPNSRDVRTKKVRDVCMDVQYLITGGIVSPTTVPPDSKSLRSESEILARKARGSCGVDPGPVRVTLSMLPMGEWLYGVRKRLA